MMHRLLALACISYTTLSFASDIPGGINRTAVNTKAKTYEMVLSPAATIDPGGAYLTAELRNQISEDYALGFAFGAGELGTNFGGNFVWYIFPDLSSQPGFALMGGVFYKHQAGANYLVARVAPIVSHSFKTGFGHIAPYGALNFTPALNVGGGTNTFGVKTTIGAELDVTSMRGARILAEFGVGLTKSAHELVVSLAYPFTLL